MARPLRIEFAGALYHITSRGDRREDIFLDDADREMFFEVLAEVCDWREKGVTISPLESIGTSASCPLAKQVRFVCPVSSQPTPGVSGWLRGEPAPVTVLDQGVLQERGQVLNLQERGQVLNLE
jgi:hypothetical protein